MPAPEESIVYIALDIQARKQILSDPIPTEPGTSIAFAVGNATGGAGDFIVQFYVIDAKTYVLLEIHREKVHLAPGAVFELPAYRFDKPGKYKLAVKGSWGTLLLERSFELVAGR